jgi:anaerobic magnesium-protoporphyrin IX monomethyl ester cyclase
MRLQLVFAPPETPTQFGELGEQINPPLGILYLAAYVRKFFPQVEISIVDGLRQGYQKTVESIEKFGPDILGISFYTPTASSALRLATRVKEAHPSAMVLLGGAHATSLPEECLEKSKADALVYGEGEETLREIVGLFLKNSKINAFPWDGITGVYHRYRGKVTANPPRRFIQNLDNIPFPARDLVDMKDYSGYYLYKTKPQTLMIMSRGCPANCTFCSKKVWETSTPRIRVRSPKNIADEIEHLKKEYGIREVFDNGDEFNNHLSNAKDVCRELISRKLDVDWMTLVRAVPLDDELVELMARSGCWCAGLGIESGNPEALKGICKGITLQQAEQACRLLKKHGLKVHAFFMLFNVWEDQGALKYEDAAMTRNTLNFARGLVDQKLLDYLGWSITTPYPGSQLYDIALRHNLIPSELAGNWDAWLKETSFVLNLPGVSHKEMADMKAKGSLLRARLMLRSGGIGLKDASYFIKKAGKLAHNLITVWQEKK